MLMKATFFFHDLNSNAGWSESHYRVPPASHSAVLHHADLLAEKRAKLLGANVKLHYVRVSDDSLTRDSLVSEGPTIVNASEEGQPPVYDLTYVGKPADFPWVALLCRAESGFLYRKSIYLRGMPDVWTHAPSGKMVEEYWKNKFNQYKNALRNNWAFKALSKDPSIAPQKAITNVAVSGFNCVVSCPSHGFAVGDKIRIAGVKFTTIATGLKINGVWQIGSVPDGNSFTIIGGPPSIAYLSGGTAQKRVYDIQPYDEISMQRFIKKSTGKPFFLPTGKRRVRH